jgi:hypothetical protein
MDGLLGITELTELYDKAKLKKKTAVGGSRRAFICGVYENVISCRDEFVMHGTIECDVFGSLCDLIDDVLEDRKKSVSLISDISNELFKRINIPSKFTVDMVSGYLVFKDE